MEGNGTTNFFDMSAGAEDNQETKNNENNASEQKENVQTQHIESEDGNKTTVFDMSSQTDEEKDNKQKETDANKKNPDESQKNKDKETSKETDTDSKSDNKQTEKKTFKIKSNKPANETETKENENADKAKKETKPLSAEQVLGFLKSELQIDVSDLSELSKKQVLPESVRNFKKFVEETGRGHVAYFNSNKDWSKEDKDVTIKEALKYQNPNLSEQDINDKLSLMKLSEEDKEEMTDREIKRHELQYNSEYSEALAYMQKISSDYGTKLEEVKPTVKQPTPEEIAEAHRPYWNKRDKSLDNFNEVVIPLEGYEEIKIPLNQELKDLISKRTQTQGDYFADWMTENENGSQSVDTDKSVQEVSWSIPAVRNYYIEEILSQAYTMFMEQYSKENRHVDLDKPMETQQHQQDGVTVTKSNTGGVVTNPQMGEPLIGRS